ncbi:RNA polymerase primary sigma factor [Filimonas zeae]|uniref:RNA polymerase sigma factor RpoD n=1 Tax=Filimonas zeae TaxID=1737353 RepID=A0A917MYX0_9BACT|nr:RNA polymerase primary sigma factor [Filimonas zeae]GGH79852.1 RNA polymerase sigma factor RpoD [Filimonas zeae]
MSMRQLKITKSITNRESQSLEKYLQEIGKVDMVTAEDEVRLASEIKKGNQTALERLIKANLRFVVSVAKQYQNQGLSLSDLINEGNLGLIRAAIRFDETKGFKFISYAVWWIRQSILQSLAEQSRIVRLPLNKVGLSNRISRAFQQLEQEYEREPTPEEVAELLEVGLEDVSASMSINSRHVSMDSPLSDSDDAITLVDVLENSNAESTDRKLDYYESLSRDVQRSMLSLTSRQKDVLCYFYGIGVDHPLSLEDIGERFNLTRERVRQIKDKALSKLKTKTCSHLRVYLG